MPAPKNKKIFSFWAPPENLGQADKGIKSTETICRHNPVCELYQGNQTRQCGPEGNLMNCLNKEEKETHHVQINIKR